MNDPLERYAFDLRKSTAPPNHIGVGSLFGVTSPLHGTVMGVIGCFSPPYAAGELLLSVRLEADDRLIDDAGSLGKDDCGLLPAAIVWRPDRIVRRGTYHWRREGKTLSFSVVSELVPLSGAAGFVLVIRARNRSGRAVPLRIVPRLDPGRVRKVPLGEWNFVPPSGGRLPTSRGDGIWESEAVRISLRHEGLAFHPDHGEEAVCRLAVVLTDAGADAESDVAEPSLAEREDETTGRWRQRIRQAEERVPRLESDIPGLEDYYRRSLISGLICLWEHPLFKIQPLPSVSGMDGGGINSYPWDAAGYAGQVLTMLLGADKSMEYLRFMEEGGIDRHISFAPDGTGDKPFAYSYSLWSFVHFAWSTFCQHGADREWFSVLRRVLEVDERRLSRHGDLLDYGEQHHLLEMRGSGYEHVVCSPNAERAWCYERLADLAAFFGMEGAAEWKERADRIREAIREELWDESAGWFHSVYPDGHRELVYSIQAYDALRMGACTSEMAMALLSHLQDGKFLGPYGVSSVSAEDELHYELNDPDWSGGGSFAGEGPILAQTLWETGHPDLAWDVLKRHLWMGSHLPYFPQEHYCDRPMTPAHKRANNISGLAGVQAILFGMAGMRPQLDGSLLAFPRPPAEGRVTLIGYTFRGHRIDVRMEPGYCRIDRDGSCIYEGAPKRIRVV